MAIRAKNENITDSNAIKIKYCGSSLMWSIWDREKFITLINWYQQKMN
jgi:hypothetical protein